MLSKLNKRDLLGYVALAIMGVTSAIAIYYFGYAPTHFRIATPPTGSELTQFFNAMALALDRDKVSVRFNVTPFDNNDDISNAITAGRVDLAAVRADRPLPPSALGVVELHKFTTLVLARPGASIAKFADLRGRKVAEFSRGETGAGVFARVFAANQMTSKDLDIITIGSLDELGPAAREQNIDALLVALPRGGRGAAEILRILTSAFGKAPIVVPLAEAKAIAAGNPVFTAGEIAPGELNAVPELPEKATPTLVFSEILVARRQLSSGSVQELTKQLFTVRQSLIASYPAAGRLTKLSTDRGSAFAVHPGAAVYYNASETPFLDQYSNLIWLFLFGFSTVVSAFVWFARRLFPHQREMLRADHAELIAMIDSVRKTSDIKLLDAAEERVDEIVANLSNLVFNGVIDAEQQPAFDLAIARIEKIIEDRRKLLGDRPA